MRIALDEELAQGTVEYAIVTVALLAIVIALASVWRAGTDGAFSGLVERAASHALAAGGADGALSGAKDIALY